MRFYEFKSELDPIIWLKDGDSENINYNPRDKAPKDNPSDIEADTLKTVEPEKRQLYRSIIENYIDGCIPNEFEQNESIEAKEWLRTQLNTIEDVRKFNQSVVRFALRGFFMNRTNRGKLKNYTLPQLIDLPDEKYVSIGLDDESGLQALIQASRRIDDQIIMTNMSGLENDRITMSQQLYDVLANYLGQRYKAKKIQAYIDSRFNVDHGVFLLFRNVRDPGVYINVLIDTDRRIIRAGKNLIKMKIITTDQKQLDKYKLRNIIVENNNNKREDRLYDRVVEILDRIQTTMNDDKVPEVYQYLGVRYEQDQAEEIAARDEKKINQRPSV